MTKEEQETENRQSEEDREKPSGQQKTGSFQSQQGGAGKTQSGWQQSKDSSGSSGKESQKGSQGEGGQKGQGGQKGGQGKSDQQSQDDQKRSGGTKSLGLPEWVSFGVGLAVVLFVLALLTYLHLTGETGRPQIAVTPKVDLVSLERGLYYLPVDVANTGGQTAEDVQIQISLDTGQSNPETITYQIRFLPPNEVDRTLLVFHTNPAEGQLTYLASFSNP